LEADEPQNTIRHDESFGLNGWWITREFRYRCAGILAFYETRLTATCTTHKHTKITPTTALG